MKNVLNIMKQQENSKRKIMSSKIIMIPYKKAIMKIVKKFLILSFKLKIK